MQGWIYQNLTVSIETIFSVIIGGLITCFVSWVFYKKAGQELKDEAKKLHFLSELILYRQDHPDSSIELNRDKAGNVIGLKVNASFTANGTSTAEFRSQ